MENRFRFRCWLKKEKRMLYLIKKHAISFERDYIREYSEEYTNTGFPKLSVEHDFNDCVLMQSTGLSDKKGKEIFENDILKIKDNIYKIIWDKDCLQYFLEKDGFKFCWSDCFDEEKRKFIVEIIGNSFDNKELLGE